MKRAAIREGVAYTGRSRGNVEPWRRVVGIVQGHVIYSLGTDRNRRCKLATFARWARGELSAGIEVSSSPSSKLFP